MNRFLGRFSFSSFITYFILIILTVIIIAPFISILLASFKTPAELVEGAFALPDEFNFQNYVNAWNQGNFGVYTRNSVFITFWVVTIGTLFSILGGFAFGLMRFPLHRILFIIFLIGLMVPQETYIIPLYHLQKDLGLNNTILAVIIPQIGMSVCFGIFWMRGFFEKFPRDLLDAAQMDGCNTWQVLWRVLVPNATAAISTMMVLFFVWTWNDFLLALVMVSSDSLRPLPLGLALFQGRWAANVPLIAAGATLVILPSLVIYIFLQRQFIRGITAGSLHGS